ncbi:MAG TPA: DNRLRE domain-containing protein [Gaiellaceae bacterium]
MIGKARQAAEVRPPGGWATAIAVAVAAFVVAGPVAPRPAGASAAAQDVVKRTQKSVTYRNGDGSFTTSLYAAPVNYRDRQGRWQPISSKLVPAAKPGYAFRNEANSFDALFKAKSGPGYLHLDAAGAALDLTLEGAAESAASVSGDEIVYPGVRDGVDLRYALAPDGLKETLVLANAGAPTQYSFTLTPAAGLHMGAKRLRNGAWAFVAPGHPGPLFQIAPPRVDEAGAALGSSLRGGPRGPKNAVTLDVTRAGRSFVVQLTVDEKWLLTPGRRFPVLLDPTIKIQPPMQTADFQATCPSCTDMGSPLWIGTDETDSWRAAVQFDLADLPPGATVSSATLGLWNDETDCLFTSTFTCGDNSHTINAYRMTNAWNTTSTTTNQLGWDATVLSSYTLAAHAASGWMSWDVKTTVQNWVNGTQPNYGFLLKRTTEPLDVGGPAPPGADAYDPTQAPKLDVTYTSDAVKLYKPETLHSNGADLRWSPYAYPDGHAFQGYEIHRSPTANFTASASTLIAKIGDPTVTTYRDTSAAAGKTFSYKILVNGWPSYEQTVTLPADGYATKTLQLGPESNGTDLAFMTGDPNCDNHGTDDDLMIGDDTDGWTPATNWFYRPLLQFDLRDIPANATVSNATLSLHTDIMPPAQTVTVNVHRVTSAWTEGTGFGACTGDGASWNETYGGVKWKTAGGDYDPTVVASKVHTVNDVEGWDDFNVASAVQKWVSSDAPNLGLLLKFASETPVSANWFAYASDDYSDDPTWRPKLSLTYTDGSHAAGPSETIASPAPSDIVSGSAQTVNAAASDDSQVSKVEFLVDGAVKSTDTTAPYSMTWNTTADTNAAHSLTARATDDAGNVTTSSATSVTVDNTAQPTTSVTAPLANATVSGSAVSFTASASGGRPISRVEFFVDGVRLTDDTTSPYSVTWNTLDQAVPSYDATPHTLTTKAYDSVGRIATSSGVTVTTTNTTGTKYKAGFSPTAIPPVVTYDPTLGTQDKSGVDVTVTNNSGVTWLASDVVLRSRWYSPDAPAVVTDGPDVLLGSDLPAGQSRVLRVLVDPPTLPDGVDRAQYTLRFDLYSKTSLVWFADKGNQPNENPVIVNKALVRDALGLERYYQYDSENLGAGMQHLVNVANGNSLLRWEPLTSVGRGLDTKVDLTYNALEKKCECQGGNNWSVGISTLTRFGNPIDIHPNNADAIAGRSNKFIEYADADGTTHRFTDSNSDGNWEAPAGEHLYLRVYSTTDTTKKWALTTPDRITYFYDVDGYPTSVQDKNGQTLTLTESTVAAADDPGGVKKHISSVTDAGGRSYTITYWTKADAKKPQVRGKIKRIADHSGHALDFEYYEDGNLLRIIERGGTKADGSFLADRSYVFTYTTSDGSGPAIPLAANRVNPDPKTPNESTRIYSVRDPRGTETTFAYLGPGFGTDRWKLASRTDRSGATTTYTYDATNRVTTVTLPLSRVWKYGYDTEGKVTSITNPKNQVTTQAWSSDRQLTMVTEPTGNFRERAFNANGLVTDEWDQLRNHTTYEYENVAVDGNDVSGKWEAGRTIPHISQISKLTTPKGVATATPTNDFQWAYAYDSKGNLTRVTDPLGYATAFTYNLDGTVASQTDANNHTTTYVSHDANGLATEIRDAKSQTTRFGFDADGNQLWLQDPLHANDTGANAREYRQYSDYDSFHRLGATSEPKSTSQARGTLIWTATDYDPNNNVTSQASPAYSPGGGAKTTYSFDAMDRATAMVGPDQSTGSERTEYVYDSAGRPTRVTLPLGVATTAIANDYVTETAYDTLDRVTKETLYPKDGNSTGTRVTNYCYDLASDLRSVTAPHGALSDAPTPFTSCPAESAPSSYVYTAASYSTKYSYNADHTLKSTIDPLGDTSSQTYDANTNVDTETDEESNVLRYTFNQRDDLIQQEEPFDPSRPTRKLFTKYTYDGVGNLASEISPRAVDTQGAGPYTTFVTTYGYDAVDQLTMITQPVDGSTRQAWTHYGYDTNGNQTFATLPVDTNNPTLVAANQQTRATYFDTGAIRTIDYPDKGVTTFDYTAQGWQSSRKPAGGPEETWTYYDDGELKEQADPNGHPSKYTYDLDNNLIRTEDASGVDSPTESPLVVEQDYNGFDEPTEIRQRKEPPGQTPPAWRITDYTYDANGNLQTRLDEGRTQTFGYDQADRFTSQLDANGAGCADDRQLTATYLRNSWQTGEVVSKSDGTCTPTNWPIKRQTAWTYFQNGRPQTVQSWKGTQTPANLIESHTLDYETGGVYLNGNRTKDTFTLQGPGTASCRATSCAATFAYDARDRLTQWVNGLPGTEASTTAYTLDATTTGVDTLEGNVTKEVVTGANARTRDYTYNTAGQLKSLTINGVPNQLYFYDSKTGDIRCVTDPGYTASLCDGDGSAKPGLRDWYKFDPLDRMKAFKSYRTNATVDTSYVYDAFDRVSNQTEVQNGGPARTSSFTYLVTSDEISSDTQSGASTTSKRYTYDLADERVDATVTTSSTQDYSYGRNMRGDVSLLVDDSGAVADSYGYKPYGNLDGSISRGDLDATNPFNAFRFNDKRFDSGSRSIDMGARRYEPDDGRFLQQDFFRDATDELGISQNEPTENRYAYAGGNPVTFVEKDGHAPHPPFYPGQKGVQKKEIYGPRCFTGPGGTECQPHAHLCTVLLRVKCHKIDRGKPVCGFEWYLNFTKSSQDGLGFITNVRGDYVVNDEGFERPRHLTNPNVSRDEAKGFWPTDEWRLHASSPSDHVYRYRTPSGARARGKFREGNDVTLHLRIYDNRGHETPPMLPAMEFRTTFDLHP